MRYHFHIRDSNGLVTDEEGSELSDMDAARAEAWASARDLAIEDLRSGDRIERRYIEIATTDGRVIQRLAVRDMLN